MTLRNVITSVRILLNDNTESVWTDAMITAYINQALYDLKITLPLYFVKIKELELQSDDEVIEINSDLKEMISLYGASRGYFIDEQYYKSTELRNEYEVKKTEAINDILSSDEYSDILNEDGEGSVEYVIDIYSDAKSKLEKW